MKHIPKAAKKISLLLVFVMLLCGCGGGEKKVASQPDMTDDNYRVFYQIFVGSFSDSNGDGVGDIRGIINRMDYLNDGNVLSEDSLGVQGIWLSPIFESPSYHKYDASDYYKIDEEFGTEEDLRELVALCHERNVKVILDLAINHSSSSNLWFQKFISAHKAGDTSDPYYDFYSWVTKENMVGGIAYNTIPGVSGEYYECNFSGDMPELNFDNEQVREEMLRVAKHYLDLGIDGFRFDAVKYIYYNNTAESVDFWKWYMDELTAYRPDIYCVGECWSGDSETLKYVEALNCFNFQMSQSEGQIASAAKGNGIDQFTRYVERYQDQVQAMNSENGMMVSFLSNHDMDRAAGYMTVASKMAYMAANIYLLSPGSQFIYYGEEIGLKGTRGGANTDSNRRLAMLWGDDDTIKDPVGTTYQKSKQTNGTVAEQLANEEGLLRYYSKVLTIRNTYPEIPRGDYKALSFGSDVVGGFLITYQGKQTVLLHNTSGNNAKEIDLSACADYPDAELSIAEVVGQGKAKLDGTVLTIDPYTSVILKGN